MVAAPLPVLLPHRLTACPGGRCPLLEPGRRLWWSLRRWTSCLCLRCRAASSAPSHRSVVTVWIWVL